MCLWGGLVLILILIQNPLLHWRAGDSIEEYCLFHTLVRVVVAKEEGWWNLH
jgi:hypothetical protein